MNLREHYKFHSRKSIKPYSRLILLIIIFISVFHTFSKYTNSTNASDTVQVAKWAISVNEETITTETSSLSQSIELKNVSDDSVYMDSGDECYFDIIISPTQTEVALEYQINIDLTSGTNALPTGTKIKEYELYTGNPLTLSGTTSVDATNTIISGNYSLNNGQALDDNSTRKYRIYCTLPNDVTFAVDRILEVQPVITLQQII